jgi:hypothetical protein
MKPLSISILTVALTTIVFGMPASAQSTNFSGYELFPGVSRHMKSREVDCAFSGQKITSVDAKRSTTGASFSGWTDGAGDWVSPSSTTGGLINGSVNYLGTPGFGDGQQDNYVCVTGGIWSWIQSDEGRHGKILDGYVEWPPDSSGSIDSCPPGVAVLAIDVSESRGSAGQLTGCLNDQLAFPPQIWGVITLE